MAIAPVKTKAVWGAVGRARAFFSDPENAGEYLTHTDMKVKFGFMSDRAVAQAIYNLKLEGLVCSAIVVFADPERPR